MDQAPKPLQLYLAAPLFTQAERLWNRALATALEEALDCNVALPQDIPVDERKDKRQRFGAIFRSCIEGMEACDAMVAVADGADADSGTAFEMGYAYAIGKPVVAVRTDYRRQQEKGTNLMISRGCHGFVHVPALQEGVTSVAAAIAREIERVVRKRRTRQ